MIFFTKFINSTVSTNGIRSGGDKFRLRGSGRLRVCRTLSDSMQKIVQKYDFYRSNSVRCVPFIIEFYGK